MKLGDKQKLGPQVIEHAERVARAAAFATLYVKVKYALEQLCLAHALKFFI